LWGRRERDRIVVGFTTIYAISAYHQTIHADGGKRPQLTFLKFFEIIEIRVLKNFENFEL
jgi:hypothetical protein